MTDPDRQAAKQKKKEAKAAQKLLKKQHKTEEAPADSPGASPAERTARAAEQKVTLERWRTRLAAVGIIIALLTLLVMALRSL